jgi:hypothetical protein
VPAPSAPGPDRAPTPPGGAAPRRPEPAIAAPADASPAAGPAASSSGGGSGTPPTLAQLNDRWSETIVPNLRGVTKAMYSVGRFTGFDGSTATLALPNEVHRQKCDQKRGEVEGALRDALGSPVSLALVVDDHGDDGGGGGYGSDGAGGGGGGRGPVSDDDFDLGGTDVHDLDDAPDAPVGGLQALTDAFPGAELIEGT